MIRRRRARMKIGTAAKLEKAPSINRAPREPSMSIRRVLLRGYCQCGKLVEFVAGCGWLAPNSWDPCTHE